jgi:hypothetical protein
VAKAQYRWEFTQDLKGGHRGFNNPELERFKNGRYRSLTREVIQNSLDAVDDKTKPVRVEFHSDRYAASDIPDARGLAAKIGKCIPMARRDKNRAEAAPWFENAYALITGTSIYVLKMSDFNTRGMRGPCEYGTPFYAYMKAMGASEKDGATAAGSHGIGKRAPLLSSKLRSLIAVTQFNDPKSKQNKFLAQGFSLLMTHEERVGKKTISIDAEGYWGDPDGCLPSDKPESLPTWMRRKIIGTDIYLLGFDRAPKWEEKMVALTITNYFAAISRGTLEVKIQDTEITRTTLPKLLAKKDDYEGALDDPLDKSQFKYAPYFMEALEENNAEVKVERAEIIHLGLVEMRIIVREGLPQEYAVIRANMLIITELPDLRRFPNYKDFIAVVECKTADGETLLRSIEPSRHDNFEIDQLESEELKRKARVAISKLVEFIRKSLKKHAREPLQQAGSVDFLGQFLPDEAETGKDAADAEIDPNGKIVLTPKPVRTKPSIPAATKAQGEEGAPEGKNAAGTGKEGTGGDAEGDGEGDKGAGMGAPAKNLAGATRVIETATGMHALAFTVPRGGQYRVSVHAVGLDSEEALSVVVTDNGTIQNGSVVLAATANQRIKLNVKLNRSSLGTYRLVCEEVK